MRIRLSTLFVGATLCAIAISIVTRSTPLERIQRVLLSNLPDAAKVELLSEYLVLGDHKTVVLRNLQAEPYSISGGSERYTMYFDDYDLVLSFRSDGTLYRIGFLENQVQSSTWKSTHELASAPLVCGQTTIGGEKHCHE
jgi:hypothetical protein